MDSPDSFIAKPLAELTAEEWEALCDGCGRCCYRTFITGRGKREKICPTRIACDLLDVQTEACTDYANRFKRAKDCVRLTKHNVGRCDWLPQTCAYRLRYYTRPLPDWHPLVSGRAETVREAGIPIPNGIHERDAGDDWERFVIEET